MKKRLQNSLFYVRITKVSSKEKRYDELRVPQVRIADDKDTTVGFVSLPFKITVFKKFVFRKEVLLRTSFFNIRKKEKFYFGGFL